MPREATVQLFSGPGRGWDTADPTNCPQTKARVPEATLDQPPRATSWGGAGGDAEHPRVPARWNEPFNLLALQQWPQTLVFSLQNPE